MTEIDKLYKEIAKKIRLYESGPAVDSMERMGLKYAKNHGVSTLHLKQIAESYHPNTELAAHLRQRSIREMRILAEMIVNPADVSEELAHNIVQTIDTGELAEQHCKNLFEKLEIAQSLSLNWISRESEFVISSGFILIQRLCMKKKINDKANYERIFSFAGYHSTNKSIHVRKSIARALRQIGLINELLREQVIKITYKIKEKKSSLTDIIAEEVIPLLQ